MKVKPLSPRAQIPARKSDQAAGYDIFSSEKCFVDPGNRKLVSTDISLAIPEGYYGRVAPRSGLAVKHGIDVGAGVIDSDYRGEVKILICNNSDKRFFIEQGDRIAQLIITKIFLPELEVVDNLDETARGSDGFGSTGTN